MGCYKVIIEGYISRNQWYRKSSFGGLAEFFTPKFRDLNYNHSKLFPIQTLMKLPK